MPALNATTGMPASIAFLIVGTSAGGSGMVTAMPSTLLSIADWIRGACLPESGSEEYFRVTLSLADADSAPLRMMSQKVSPGAAWVIMAIVIWGVLALPAEIPALLSAAFLPPELLQAPADTRRIVARATAPARLACLNISCLRCCGDGAPGDGRRCRSVDRRTLMKPSGNAWRRRARTRRAATWR